jgi:hypothetical protein
VVGHFPGSKAEAGPRVLFDEALPHIGRESGAAAVDFDFAAETGRVW